MTAYPHHMNIDLNNVFEISVGPRDNYDGIKSCLTYNPPGGSKPGFQRKRGVSTRVLMDFQVPSDRGNQIQVFH